MDGIRDDWQKSSYCAEGNNCLEVGAGREGALGLRESTAPGRVLSVAPASLGALLRAVRAGGGSVR